MMSYEFARYLLLRMPVKRPVDYRNDQQVFLDDHFFRSALYLASQPFYKCVESHHFRFDRLSNKEAFTLQKYINRYCFRPTPFGLFASVSLIKWQNNMACHKENPSYTWVCRPDMSYIQSFDKGISDHLENFTFEINPFIYRVMNEYRFIRTWIDPDGKSRDYQLQSIAYNTLIRDLVSFCKSACSKQRIVEQIAIMANCSQAESLDYTDFLIDAQILISKNRVAITGKEQFQALTDSLAGGKLKSKMEKLSNRLAGLPPAAPNEQTAALAAVQQELTELLPYQGTVEKPKLSVILKRVSDHDQLAAGYQSQIREGITALSLLSGDDEVSAMSNFVSTYLKHFEGQTLPLMVALDPEAGVGYQQPLKVKNNPLLETLDMPQKRAAATQRRWSERHSLLMEVWLRDRSVQPVIRLAEPDLQRLKGYREKQQMLGMSVLFRVIGERVYIENAGGTNAPALLGRFTVADESIKNAAADMARALEMLNPDVIFAELLHLSDPHTDNVNTREQVYHYEIPITAASTLPVERQIPLSDLYVCIVENKAVLYSQKHQKVVVPRLTSAYNHSLNKLPLFRFLADLPYQYGQYGLGLDLRQFFPGQSFYPRVEYRDTILSPATWVIKNEELSPLQKAGTGDIKEAYRELSERLMLPSRFSLAEGDQELVFDCGQGPDIHFFVECTWGKKEILLKEFPEQDDIRQYNCYLLPDEPLSLPRPMDTLKVKGQRKYIPGSEWLYLKIYAPKVGADRLLLYIRPLLGKIYSRGKLRKWFFIRYEDHAPHIRLRLKVAPEGISEVLLAFKNKLDGRIHQHLIREYHIDIYSRELERYAYAGIERTELFFCADSELVMGFLHQNQKGIVVSSYAFALCTTLIMIEEFVEDTSEQAKFALESYQQFAAEFSDRSFKAELDKKYRELTPGIKAALINRSPDLLCGSSPLAKIFLKCLKDTHIKPGRSKDKTAYLRSLIHMHLNRVFTDDGRKQEMIIYYLLQKYLLSAQGQARRSTASHSLSGSLSPNAHP